MTTAAPRGAWRCVRPSHITPISQNTERKQRPKETQELSHQVASGWGPTFQPGLSGIHTWVQILPDHPLTQCPSPKPHFPWTKTELSTAPCSLNVDVTHRKHWWQRAWKSPLSQAGCIQPVSLQRGHYKVAESRAQPHTVHAIEQRRALEPGDQQGLALRASNELQHPGDPAELRMLGLATAGGGRQAGRQLGCKPDPRIQAVLHSPWSRHYHSTQSACRRWE